ncbi:MBL fold metallo-hydrolase [Parerythrobacter aurantius]|uniref:MBL fold metallo-hydrolase n=1 Tax=Parerythrobacter aurantius TaxID=3127706 RepID=UPI0032530E9D
MKRLLIGTLLAVLLGLAGAFYWLFYDNRPPAEGTFPLDIAALRKEAARLPGTAPVSIEVETLYWVVVPRIALVTGTDWSDMSFVRNSYRVVWPDTSLIIDTGSDESTAQHDPRLTRYDQAAWARVQKGLSAASTIVVTHEHCDHIGGLLQSPNLSDLLPKAILNDAQFSNIPECTVWPEGSRQGYVPLKYDGIRAIAPGVVLIRAPGHTAGSHMVYVRQADGREFLFAGDTASSLDNVRLIRPRSRYVMEFGGHEDDREEVFRQTIAIKRLMDENPALALVPGHDEAALLNLEKQGLLKRGFSLP